MNTERLRRHSFSLKKRLDHLVILTGYPVSIGTESLVVGGKR